MVLVHFPLKKNQFLVIVLSLKTCVLINNNFCGKLVSSLELPITFDESFKVTSGPIFIPDFDLLACKDRQFYI